MSELMSGHYNKQTDLGVFGTVRRIAELWAGLIPILLLARILVGGEIRESNIAQDSAIKREYISRVEYEERNKLIDERMRGYAETLKDIRDEQKSQRQMLEAALGMKHK